MYRYIDDGLLTIGNIDLRRKVSYRQRRKSKARVETITNVKFRQNRTYVALGIANFRKLFPAILTDNGSEFKYTLEMERTVDGQNRTRIFYCDPQASWQKPHIEKNHEYIRYTIPKGTDLNPFTQEDFTLLASHINSTKRAQYNGKSPIKLVTSEEFRYLLHITGFG